MNLIVQCSPLELWSNITLDLAINNDSRDNHCLAKYEILLNRVCARFPCGRPLRLFHPEMGDPCHARPYGRFAPPTKNPGDVELYFDKGGQYE